ncbi:xanthine dehydrogenase accessory protein XdhC [Frigidibacter sp. RF13]|uniref:xanthine dehydrogenase accessory protein XdhC n=1 Tax=Frigidibacter sp. RF13 TaxID=2997340 RepID=UPI0022702F19|nr:xanthine dehydrogenase accessory protein XdhC [Frigidibacter sp. RF13]MCY1127992.1 xanthine dehydrogenase accessory protein XdhC [Frigidibacter sp. RF13]
MGFDRDQMVRLIGLKGPVVRVVVADIAGSTPREVGAAMVVWKDSQEGTIGGGTLEHEAMLAARKMLAEGTLARVDRMPLGPTLGQCCGGSVALLSELWDGVRLAAECGPVIARALPGQSPDMPLTVKRLMAKARGEGALPAARLVQGWFIEPVARPKRDLWVWGAGHVGRAIVATMAGLPDLRITWVDTTADRFPDLPEGVVQRVAANPADLVAEVPANAEHLVLTFSHALDLELCHRLLGRGFARLGLIGSETKWARFRARLHALGHPAERIGRIQCPIGRVEYGKHPQAIAIGVAAEFLEKGGARESGATDGAERLRGDGTA